MHAEQAIITRNVFRNCGKEDQHGGCIEIKERLPRIRYHLRERNAEQPGLVRLKCDSNIFQSNLYDPVAEKAVDTEESLYIQSGHLYKLTNNVVTAVNAAKCGDSKNLKEPNRIYFCEKNASEG